MNYMTASRIGFWAAVLVIIFTTIFAISMIPFLPRTVLNISFLVSFLLAIAYVVMMAALFYIVAEERKVWAHVGLALSIIYATMNTSVYYIQLAVVRGNSLNLPENFIRPFVFLPGTPLFAIDMLGYGFLTLSTLFAAFAFGRDKVEIWTKRLFILHGLFVFPTLAFPLFAAYQPPREAAQDITGNIALIGWSVVFVPAIVFLTRVFKLDMEGAA